MSNSKPRAADSAQIENPHRLPWKRIAGCVFNSDGQQVSAVYCHDDAGVPILGHTQDEANAEFKCLAVNSRGALLAALESNADDAERWAKSYSLGELRATLREIAKVSRAAIAKAKCDSIAPPDSAEDKAGEFDDRLDNLLGQIAEAPGNDDEIGALKEIIFAAWAKVPKGCEAAIFADLHATEKMAADWAKQATEGGAL